MNLALYVPFGLVLAWAAGAAAGRQRRIVPCLLAVIGVSAAFEVAQLFFGRNPSITDVLLNAIGGAFGVLTLAWRGGVAGWLAAMRDGRIPRGPAQ